MKASATAVARKIEPVASALAGGVKQMKKTTILLAAAMFAAATGSAFAGWVAVPTGSTTQTLYTAQTAGKSGNVKACFQSTETTTTYTWTQSQTGATRGTFDVTTTTDEVQVDNSLCQA
jgi:hypothetical protein